jgi:hypothetical protein
MVGREELGRCAPNPANRRGTSAPPWSGRVKKAVLGESTSLSVLMTPQLSDARPSLERRSPAEPLGSCDVFPQLPRQPAKFLPVNIECLHDRTRATCLGRARRVEDGWSWQMRNLPVAFWFSRPPIQIHGKPNSFRACRAKRETSRVSSPKRLLQREHLVLCIRLWHYL